MKTINLFKIIFTALITFIFTSCSKEEETPKTPSLETITVSNLFAPQSGGQGQPIGGDFVKFSFTKGIVSDQTWDIAFRGTTILVNGGTNIGLTDEPVRTGQGEIAIINSTFENVKEVPAKEVFKQDATGVYALPTANNLGWYSYNATNHLISPLAGKILVVKTNDGKYAKMEILSYYKDAPKSPSETSISRYYTFRYVLQKNGTTF